MVVQLSIPVRRLLVLVLFLLGRLGLLVAVRIIVGLIQAQLLISFNANQLALGLPARHLALPRARVLGKIYLLPVVLATLIQMVFVLPMLSRAIKS